jgi:hypothetical protein
MINETKAHDSYGDFESSTCCFWTYNCEKQTLSRQILCTKFVNTLLEICPKKKTKTFNYSSAAKILTHEYVCGLCIKTKNKIK